MITCSYSTDLVSRCAAILLQQGVLVSTNAAEAAVPHPYACSSCPISIHIASRKQQHQRSAHVQLQISSLSKEADERAPGIAELAGAVQARQEKMAGMEEQINSVKDSMYASISKQVSPPSAQCLPACASIILPACLCLYHVACPPACALIILPACLCLNLIACLLIPQPYCLPACVSTTMPACLCCNHIACLHVFQPHRIGGASGLVKSAVPCHQAASSLLNIGRAHCPNECIWCLACLLACLL